MVKSPSLFDRPRKLVAWTIHLRSTFSPLLQMFVENSTVVMDTPCKEQREKERDTSLSPVKGWGVNYVRERSSHDKEAHYVSEMRGNRGVPTLQTSFYPTSGFPLAEYPTRVLPITAIAKPHVPTPHPVVGFPHSCERQRRDVPSPSCSFREASEEAGGSYGASPRRL